MSPIQTTLCAPAVRSSVKGALLALSLLAAVACSSTSTPADTPTPAPADTPTPAPSPAPDDIMEAGSCDCNYLLLAHYRTLSTLEANPELEGSKGVALYGRHVTEAEGHWEADYAAAEGIEGALDAIRNGQDIDLDGEATSLDWDANGDITVGGVEIWQFKDGAIENIRHFDVDVSE